MVQVIKATLALALALMTLKLADASAKVDHRSVEGSSSRLGFASCQSSSSNPLKGDLSFHAHNDGHRQLQELGFGISPGPPWSGTISPCTYNDTTDNNFSACQTKTSFFVPLDTRTYQYFATIGYNLAYAECSSYPITMPSACRPFLNKTELDVCNGAVSEGMPCYVARDFNSTTGTNFLSCQAAYWAKDVYRISACPGSFYQKAFDCKALSRTACVVTPGCVNTLPIYLSDPGYLNGDFLKLFDAITAVNSGVSSDFFAYGFCELAEVLIGLNLTRPGVASGIRSWIDTVTAPAFNDYSNSTLYYSFFGTCPFSKDDWDSATKNQACRALNDQKTGLATNESLYLWNATLVQTCLANGCEVGTVHNNSAPGQPLLFALCIKYYTYMKNFRVPDENGDRSTAKMSPVYAAAVDSCYSYGARWNKKVCEGATIDLSTLNSHSCPSVSNLPPMNPPPGLL